MNQRISRLLREFVKTHQGLPHGSEFTPDARRLYRRFKKRWYAMEPKLRTAAALCQGMLAILHQRAEAQAQAQEIPNGEV